MKRQVVIAVVLVFAASCGSVSVTPPDAGPDPDAPPSDTEAPTVVAVSPADDAVEVAAATAVTVTFSESIDPATIDEASLALSPAAAATVSYDDATRTATLTPDAPLALAARYRVEVTTAVTDLAGNPLAAAFSAGFATVRAPVETFASVGGASHGAPVLAADADGNAVAAWVASTGTERELVYALYDATLATWSTETRVAAIDGSGGPLHLVTSGTAIMLVYVAGDDGTAIHFAHDDGLGWVVGTPQVVAPSSHDDVALGSNGAGFAVAWATTSDAHVAIHDGTSWGAATSMAVGSGYTNEIHLADDTDAYAIAYLKGTGTFRTLYFAVHDGGWATPVALDAGYAHSGDPVALAGSRDGEGFAVAWSVRDSGPDDYDVEAWRYVRSGTPGVIGPVTLSSASSLGDAATPVLAARAQGGYALAFVESGLRASVFETAWGAVALVDASGEPIAIVGDNNQYAVAWTANPSWDIKQVATSIWTSGTGWSAATVHTATGLVDPQVGLATKAQHGNPTGNGFGLIYRDTDVGAPRVMRVLYGSGSWGAPARMDAAAWRAGELAIAPRGNSFATLLGEDDRMVARFPATGAVTLSTGTYAGGVAEPEIVAGDDGSAVVLWQQQVGWAERLYASHFDGGTWSAPQPVTPPDDYVDYRVASTGDAFAVLYVDRADGSLHASTYRGVAWSDEVIEASPGDFAIAGGDGEVIAVWTDADDAIVWSRFDGTTWSTTATVAAPGEVTRLRLARGPAGYAVAFSDGSSWSATTFDGSVWAAPALLGAGGGSLDSGAALVGGDAGFAFSWAASEAIQVARCASGAWSAAAAVDGATVPGGDAAPIVAASGDGYAVGWETEQEDSGFAVAVHDGASWSAPTLVAGYDLRLLGVAGGFQLVRIDQGELTSRRHDGAAWAADLALAPGTSIDALATAVDGAGEPVVMWTQDDGDATYSVRARRIVDGAWAATASLDDGDRATTRLAAGWNGSSLTIALTRPIVTGNVAPERIRATGAW